MKKIKNRPFIYNNQVVYSTQIFYLRSCSLKNPEKVKTIKKNTSRITEIRSLTLFHIFP